MAVSKRLRFEVLRRDNHTCRYCGRSAPEVKLQVDHVVPETLGGRNEASNLVTACEECNSGKTSIAPDSPVVEDVKQDALRWSRALAEAARIRRSERDRLRHIGDQFKEMWDDWTWDNGNRTIPVDPTWRASVEGFYAAGLDFADFEHAIALAMGNNKVLMDDKFRYFCGVCWRTVGDLQETAGQLVDALPDPAQPAKPYPVPGPPSEQSLALLDAARAQVAEAARAARLKARRVGEG